MGIGNWLIKIGIALGGTYTKALPKAPEHRREIGAGALRRIIRASFPKGDIHLSDNSFYLPDLEDIEKFLDQDETNRYEYKSEIFDCDDSAKRLYGQFAIPGWSHFAFGLMWSNIHAMCIVVDQNEDLWIVEPQNDNVRSNLEEWQGSEMRFIVI